MADPSQTPVRGEWACPCSGCQKAVTWERKQLIELLEGHKKDYLIYRGSSFSQITGELLWAKDDAMAYAEGIDSAIAIIKNRMPKPKNKN
jgi:hypothetical protein